MVTREEFYVNSVDGIHMIHGYRWYDPEISKKGVVQLVHGMMEYIGRYNELAEYLASKGYFVIGHDHLGHGDSVKDLSELGYTGKGGAVTWLRDIDQIRKMAVSYVPKVPYIMLGHSMGSFLVRRYLIYNGKKLDGAIIMGTGHQSSVSVKAGLAVISASNLRLGDKGHSTLLDNLTCGGFAKKYPDNSKTGSWVSRDPQVLINNAQDEKMRFRFSVSAYEALFETIEEVIDPKRVAKMPKKLPVLVLSGDEDPVGENGKGVHKFVKMLRKAGVENVTCHLYPGSRHELINDLDKEQVFKDILKWCDNINVSDSNRRKR